MPLRVLYQLCRELTDDRDLRTHTEQARGETGCREAECYRGFENPEHIAILELWEDEYAYSEHWTRQLKDDMAFSTILRSSGVRRSGKDGAEFYRHQYFQTSEGVWTPPEARGRQSRI